MEWFLWVCVCSGVGSSSKAHFRAESKARGREGVRIVGQPVSLRNLIIPVPSFREGGRNPQCLSTDYVAGHVLSILPCTVSLTLRLSLQGRPHHSHYTGGKTVVQKYTLTCPGHSSGSSKARGQLRTAQSLFLLDTCHHF